MHLRLLATVALSAALLSSLACAEEIRTSAGTRYGKTASDKISFHGATPSIQRTGAAQTALTDSTGGSTSAYTLAAGVGTTSITIPIQLASMTTAAADLITAYTPGYQFKVLAVDFVTTTLGTGTSASQALNLKIGSTSVTGGVVTPTLTSTNTLGKITAGTAVTAANTGTSSSTLSLSVAASGTAFTAGAGFVVIKLQNLDTADAFARTAALVNELRAATVAKGLIKGSN